MDTLSGSLTNATKSVNFTSFGPVNSSEEASGPFEDHSTRDLIFIIAMCVSGLLSIAGNGFTFKIITTEKNMRTPTNYLIANMAFSDVVAGILNILQFPLCTSHLYETNFFATHLCSVNQSLIYTSFFVSAFTMTIIASDRFRGIVAKPLGSRVKSGYRIAFIWFLAFLFNVPVYSTISIPEYYTKTKLITFRVLHQYPWSKIVMQVRMVVSFTTQFLLPLFVTTFAYYKILKVIKNRKLIGQQPASRRELFQKQKLKLMRMLIIIVVVFTFSWFPIHASVLVIVFTGNAFVQVEEVPTAFLVIYWFAISSNCINPFVYFWYYKEFRLHLRNSWNRFSQSTSNLIDLSIISRASMNSENGGQTPDTIF